ncbi:4'-phosphopantetheinyl transferase family protein [Mucilaginibacter sp. FT3.2]|uniref:4'-phosphopantetheinyl transferase family protein n=1 Tax=Mucilaginibacter sp. FT3.2 TaxID=2723090 RepID=UPI00162128E5|nr:4'-phosphopantetheinyl transferase superfamily protein [Mucilaginibacter sp. FT3.2]MBB6230502.1 4'-phosphopantetheinyl transferase [Mucilaginibacter sp. FT3.2]
MEQIEVDIRLLNNVEWHTAANCTFGLDSGVDVWRVHIPSNQSNIAGLQKLLQPDEVARANRYVHDRDRVRFIVSRAALRQLLGKYTGQPAEAVRFIIGDNKKPYINGADLKYNISHSGTWVLIAIANTAIGVDTEKIDPAFNYSTILDDYFSLPEIHFIGQSAENFFLLWTRKEALTKATGQGLDDNLKYIPSLDGPQLTNNNVLISDKNWQVSSFKLDEENWATLVSVSDSKPIRLFDYQ